MAAGVVVGCAFVDTGLRYLMGVVPLWVGDGRVPLMRLSHHFRKGACLCSHCLRQRGKAVLARAIAVSSDNSKAVTQQPDPIALLRARIERRNAMRAWRKLGEVW
jgi:hypothetical protein